MLLCPKCSNEYESGTKVCPVCGAEVSVAENEVPSTKSGEGYGKGITDFTEIYQNNAQKAEENRSSAYTLLGVGGIGLILMIFGMMGILPITFSSTTKYMVYGVMSALFLLFIVMGFISLKSSILFAGKAESENTLKDTMEKWCLENLEADKLDIEGLDDTEELTEEMKYFKRTELIKQKIQAQFLHLDIQFLEHFVDEIYGDIFEEKE